MIVFVLTSFIILTLSLHISDDRYLRTAFACAGFVSMYYWMRPTKRISFLLICDCIFALIAAIIAYYRVKWTLLLQICVSIILILYAFSWYLRFKKKYIIQKRFHIMAHIFIIYFLTLV